jgi:hypothetical protein
LLIDNIAGAVLIDNIAGAGTVLLVLYVLSTDCQPPPSCALLIDDTW